MTCFNLPAVVEILCRQHSISRIPSGKRQCTAWNCRSLPVIIGELAQATHENNQKTMDGMERVSWFLLLCKLGDLCSSTQAEARKQECRHHGARSLLEWEKAFEPPAFACISWIFAGIVFCCTLIFPTARQESQPCLIRCLKVCHRFMLFINTNVLKHRNLNNNYYDVFFYNPAANHLSMFTILLTSLLLFSHENLISQDIIPLTFVLV